MTKCINNVNFAAFDFAEKKTFQQHPLSLNSMFNKSPLSFSVIATPCCVKLLYGNNSQSLTVWLPPSLPLSSSLPPPSRTVKAAYWAPAKPAYCGAREVKKSRAAGGGAETAEILNHLLNSFFLAIIRASTHSHRSSCSRSLTAHQSVWGASAF